MSTYSRFELALALVGLAAAVGMLALSLKMRRDIAEIAVMNTRIHGTIGEVQTGNGSSFNRIDAGLAHLAKGLGSIERYLDKTEPRPARASP